MLEQLQQAFGQALTAIVTFLPLLGAFLLVLVIGYFVAKGLEKATDAVLERVGFDRAVERGGIKKALSKSRYDASSLVSKTVYYIVGLFVLQFAFGVFGPNPVSALIAEVVAYLPNLLVAGIIVVIGAAVAAAVRDIVDASLGGLSYGKALGTAAAVAILFVTAFAALDQLNVAPAIVTGLFYATLAIVAGSAIVAIGGSGIGPMRRYWDRALNRVEAEAPKVAQQTQGAQERVKERAQQRQQQAKQGMGADGERQMAGSGSRSSGPGTGQRPL